MSELAAHWVERVLPAVPIRQWVLTFPWDRRWLLARRPDLVKGVMRCALREVYRWVESRARGVDGTAAPRTGSVTVLQRFGSALNLNLHAHVLVLDGAYVEAEDGALRFIRVPPPTTEEIAGVVIEVAEACEGWLARQGFGRDEDLDEDVEPEDAQAVLQSASIAGRHAVGRHRGRRARRVQVIGGREVPLPPRCAAYEGYNLHAGVSVGSRRRAALERLCRYLARPPLARTRLERLPDGDVLVKLKRTWSDGTTAMRFTPLQLVERLAALVPPPRAHQVLYHGVLAPRAALRPRVVPKPPPPTGDPPCSMLTRKAAPSAVKGGRLGWAELLWRVFGERGWTCPTCGERMRLHAVVVRPPATTKVLASLSAGARSPPRSAVV